MSMEVTYLTYLGSNMYSALPFLIHKPSPHAHCHKYTRTCSLLTVSQIVRVQVETPRDAGFLRKKGRALKSGRGNRHAPRIPQFVTRSAFRPILVT